MDYSLEEYASILNFFLLVGGGGGVENCHFVLYLFCFYFVLLLFSICDINQSKYLFNKNT